MQTWSDQQHTHTKKLQLQLVNTNKNVLKMQLRVSTVCMPTQKPCNTGSVGLLIKQIFHADPNRTGNRQHSAAGYTNTFVGRVWWCDMCWGVFYQMGDMTGCERAGPEGLRQSPLSDRCCGSVTEFSALLKCQVLEELWQSVFLNIK